MSLIKLQGNASGTGALTIAAPNTNTDRTLTLPDTTGTIVMNEGSGIFKIDSSGNVGIGTSSPGAKLELATGNAGLGILDATNRLRFTDNDPTLIAGQSTGAIEWYTSDTDAPGVHAYIGTLGANTGAAALAFGTGIGGSATERARIASSGELLVGTSSTFDSVSFLKAQVLGGLSTKIDNTASVSQVSFFNPNGRVGFVGTSGTSTTYNTSSDYRLKDNIQPMTGALDAISQLNPVTYTWKADGSAGQGFIAHELQAIVPDCVTGEKDAVDAEGNPQYQGVDTSFLVATLVKAIQEQQSLITDLTARLTALEAN